MGVWKRPSGKWSYEFKFQGKRYGSYDFRTKAEAKAAEEKEKERLKKSTTHMTFLEAATKRLDYIRAYGTAQYYRDNLAMLRRFSGWADMLLDDISPERVRTRLIELADSLGPHNANRHLTALKATFNLAAKDGLLTRNPCLGISKFPNQKAVKYIPPREHIAQVLLLAKPLDRAYLTTIWLTGARVREINNLTWEDVFFDKALVCLWTRKKKGGDRTPRLIKIIPEVERALRYAWERRVKESPWVFTNEDMIKKYPGEPGKWAYDYRDKFLGSLCRRAGIPEFTYHCLRHHAASTLGERGASLPSIQKILGHERASTTDIYLRSLGISAEAAMGLLEEGTTGVTTDRNLIKTPNL